MPRITRRSAHDSNGLAHSATRTAAGHDPRRASGFVQRFVDDARIALHNSASEQQLRNLALGRHNWTFFANETGLRWYTTFRSLIASCRLHGLNAETYLEEVLRLAPHWPVHRVLELAPKYWPATRERLEATQRAILVRPWEAAVERSPRDASLLPLAS